jgi:hypothetical protein
LNSISIRPVQRSSAITARPGSSTAGSSIVSTSELE